MTSDPEVAWVIRQLLTDPAIAGRVQDRVHRGQLADLTNPVYPLVTVSRISLGVVDRFAPVSRAPIMIHAWSQQSYDEAMTLYDRAKTLLNKARGDEGGASFVLDPMTTPMQFADQEPQMAYAAAGTFRARTVA